MLTVAIGPLIEAKMWAVRVISIRRLWRRPLWTRKTVLLLARLQIVVSIVYQTSGGKLNGMQNRRGRRRRISCLLYRSIH
jgi:hypothetical protein